MGMLLHLVAGGDGTDGTPENTQEAGKDSDFKEKDGTRSMSIGFILAGGFAFAFFVLGGIYCCYVKWCKKEDSKQELVEVPVVIAPNEAAAVGVVPVMQPMQVESTSCQEQHVKPQAKARAKKPPPKR